MSDDYFSNNNDDEYWDDVYFEEHKDSFGSGSGHSSRGSGKTIGLIFCMIWGIATMFESPMAGITIIVLAIVFLK